VSAILITLLFGFAHLAQGPTGVIENMVDGAILAAVYLATKKKTPNAQRRTSNSQ
jgi:membrane protease YdiL (CAAX protease family)